MTLDSLQAIDQRITLILNSLHCEAGDWVWRVFSMIEVWFPLYLAVMFFMIRRLGWKRGLLMVLAMALTVAACDQLAGLVKDSVCRLRPCHDAGMMAAGLYVLEDYGGLYGFFSGHAANAFGFAAASSICFDADKNHRYDVYQWFIFIWAALVGLSRIFVGKHYFGDVLVGAIVGFIIGCAVAMAFRKLLAKLGWS